MSVHIVKRPRKGGDSYHVRWSRGRHVKVHIQSVTTEPRAITVRELALDDLARGIDPRDRYAEVGAKPLARKTLAVWADEYVASRTDLVKDGVEASGLKQLRSQYRNVILPLIGQKEPSQVTEADYERFVGKLIEAEYEASSIHGFCKKGLRQLLRYAGVSEADNVTFSKRVKLPKIVRAQVVFAAGWVYPAVRGHLSTDEQREAWDVMEHGGLRSGEVVNLTCGQLDNERQRLTGVVSKGNAPRVVQRLEGEPDWIPKRPGAKPTDRVFPGLRQQTMADRMRVASEKVGGKDTFLHMPVPGMPMTPQDLRQLCASRLVNRIGHDGITWSTVIERDGHTSEVLHKHYLGTNAPAHETGPIAPAR